MIPRSSRLPETFSIMGTMQADRPCSRRLCANCGCLEIDILTGDDLAAGYILDCPCLGSRFSGLAHTFGGTKIAIFESEAPKLLQTLLHAGLKHFLQTNATLKK